MTATAVSRDSRLLLETPIVTLHDVVRAAAPGARGAIEPCPATALIFPYRGVFRREGGGETVVADPNHMLFDTAGETYRIDLPVEGGAGALALTIAPALLVEIVPRALLAGRDPVRLAGAGRLIDARAQALVALLRHSLIQGSATVLEGESLALTLVRRAFGERTSRARAGSFAQAKLTERTKLLLMAAPERKWSLADIGAELKVSPVYLTQVFRRVEGLPLHQYLLRLRLTRALDRLETVEDLSQLALDLGFSSHSHFTAAFRQVFGRSPADFQRATQVRR